MRRRDGTRQSFDRLWSVGEESGCGEEERKRRRDGGGGREGSTYTCPTTVNRVNVIAYGGMMSLHPASSRTFHIDILLGRRPLRPA